MTTAEAVILVPWLTFALWFPLALLGYHRTAIVGAQLIFGAVGAWHWLCAKDQLRTWPRRLRAHVRSDLLSLPVLLSVLLFLVWGWSMPYPEAWNGHHHDLLNQVQHLWKTGRYAFMAPARVSYDNDILHWPANMAFFLALFAVPGIDLIDVRPIALLPGCSALLTYGLLVAVSSRISARPLGAMAFLLAAFSYWATADFTEVTFDLFTPVVLSYFLFTLVTSLRDKKVAFSQFAVVLAFTFLTRKQLFLLCSAVLMALFLVGALRAPWPSLLRRSASRNRRAAFGLIVVMPAVSWALLTVVLYGSPLFPHDTIATARVFPALRYERLDPRLTTDAALDSAPTKATPVEGSVNASLGAYVKRHYFSLPANGTTMTPEDLFGGTSFSLLLALAWWSYLGFLGWHNLPGLRVSEKSLYRSAWAIALGYLVAYFLMPPTYEKLPRYLAYLVSSFGAIVLAALAERSRLSRATVAALFLALFASGVSHWSTSTWGHGEDDPQKENVQFLSPAYLGPIERMARKSRRDPYAIVREIREYSDALSKLGAGEQILFMEHEPGAQVPAFLGKQYLGDILYLESHPSRPIFRARNSEELRATFTRLGIAYVYRPRRLHPGFERTLVLRLVRAYAGPYRYVVPVADLFASASRQRDYSTSGSMKTRPSFS